MGTNKQNSWNDFWAEYMVWSSRIICYCINSYLFSAFRGALPTTILGRFLYDLAAFFYSIVGLYLIETFFKKVHNPSYKDFDLSDEERLHRTLAERIIFSCITFCLINFVLAIQMAFLVETVNKKRLLLGAMGGFAAGLFNFFGIILLVAQNKETGERLGVQCVMGGLFLLPPIGYILYALYSYCKLL